MSFAFAKNPFPGARPAPRTSGGAEVHRLGAANRCSPWRAL